MLPAQPYHLVDYQYDGHHREVLSLTLLHEYCLQVTVKQLHDHDETVAFLSKEVDLWHALYSFLDQINA